MCILLLGGAFCGWQLDGCVQLASEKRWGGKVTSTGPLHCVGRGCIFHWFLARVGQVQAALPGTLATRSRLSLPIGLFLSAVADGGFCGMLSGIDEAIRKPRECAGLCSSSLKVLLSPPFRDSLCLCVGLVRGVRCKWT